MTDIRTIAVIDDSRFEPPAILKRMVADGKLGKKTGQGFYTWMGP